MQVVFDSLMDTHVVPFFKANGFETKDINSETNKTLGIQSHYFYKIDGDLNRNFYFESNSENSAEKYEFTLNFGIYPYSFYQTIGFPHNDAPSGLGNLYYIASEDAFADKSASQSLTKKTDIEAFAQAILAALQGTLDAHKTIDSVDDLMQFCINQKSNAYNYTYIIRYLKITDKKELLDKYVAALRTADGSALPDWMMKDVTALLDTTVLKQKVINNFTKGMKVPKSWETVVEWSEKNIGKVIGGHFEIIENSNNLLKHLVNIDGKAAKSLAVIGDNGADNVFCIWEKDKKNAPIVMLGEAGSARVMAENMDDFIQLLAVGYYEIEAADYDSEPVFPEGAEHWKNPEFQAFYKKKFKKEVPKTGAEIVGRIATKDADFFNWICDNDALWKQWKG
jgi:hypothetical protein